MEEIFSDPCSQSNTDYFKTLHIDWSIDADVSAETLTCRSVQKFECIHENEAGILVLDTRDLKIRSVRLNKNKDVPFDIIKSGGGGGWNDSSGQPLKIYLTPTECQLGAVFDVSIDYKTSTKTSTTSWILPSYQLYAKEHHYTLTDARSVIPCQDTPKNKFSFQARISIPEVMVARISANKGEEDIIQGDKKISCVEQKEAIPTSMLAVAIGSIQSRSVGIHSKAWCEPDLIDACEFGFGDVDDNSCSDEEPSSLIEPYIYDMLVLPSILSS